MTDLRNHLEQHAKHHFSLSVQFADVISSGQGRFPEIAPFAEEVDGDGNQGRSHEQLGRLTAGTQSFTKLQDSRDIDDRPRNSSIIVNNSSKNNRIYVNKYNCSCKMTSTRVQ